MKKNQIILFALTILATGALYLIVLSNKKEELKEKKTVVTKKFISVKSVQNQKRSATLTAYGQILPFTELDVALEIQGRLQKGDLSLKPGTRFVKNQLLYKVKSEEMFYSLNARKAQLTNIIIAILPDIAMDYPESYDKWNDFLKQIKPSAFLPGLPIYSNEKEELFIKAKGFYGEYWSIKSMEEKISKYIYLAPFSGYVSEIYTEPGSIINPGGRIARIFNNEVMEVKLPIAINDLKNFENSGSVVFEDAAGTTLGTGRILRTAGKINKNTQSVDAYYSIKGVKGAVLLSGQYVTARIDNMISESVCIIPASAIKKNKVCLLKNLKIIKNTVTVVGQKQDSVYVEGLKNQDTLVVEYMTPNKGIKQYIGIEQEK